MMRLGNCGMSVLAVMIGALLAVSGDLTIFLDLTSGVYLAMIIVFLLIGAGNVINDYVDIESDKVNRPQRPIPSGKVSPTAARNFAILLFAAGIILSGFLTWIALLIAIINSALLIIYSYSLQNKILIGNIAVGYLVGSTFLFGGAAMGNILLPGLLMLLAMFSTISREIVKDLEDLEGDRKSFLRRLATKTKEMIGDRFGINDKEGELKVTKKRAKTMAIVSMAFAILVSPLPYIYGILGLSYLVVLIPTVIVLIASMVMIVKASTRKQLHVVSRVIKIGMNLGLLAFVIGVLV